MGKNRCSCCNYNDNDYKDFKRGAVDASDFEDDYRMVNLKKKTKKSRPRSETRRPCPGAEDGKHIYVVSPYTSEYRWTNDKIFYEVFGYHKREVKTCCGCGITKGWPQETERYMKIKERKWIAETGGAYNVKRGEPLPWRFARRSRSFYTFKWEESIPEYIEKVKGKEARAEAKRLEAKKQSEYYERVREQFGW